MQKVYPYKTTTDKITAAYAHIEGSGHSVEQAVHVGGRDWVLLVRSDEESGKPNIESGRSEFARLTVHDG